MSMKDTCAIVGVGQTKQGTLPGTTPLGLGVEAFRKALDDAGLTKNDIDGLLTMPGTTSPEGPLHYLRFGEAVGINPKVTASLPMVVDSPPGMIRPSRPSSWAGNRTWLASTPIRRRIA